MYPSDAMIIFLQRFPNIYIYLFYLKYVLVIREVQIFIININYKVNGILF